MAASWGENWPEAEWHRANEEAKRRLLECGAILGKGFHSTGKPQIFFNTYADKLNLEDFRGRIVFEDGATIYNGPFNPFRMDTTKLTVCQWAGGIGQIIVRKNTTLSATSIVSYVCVDIGQEVLFGPGAHIMDCDGHGLDRTLDDGPGTPRPVKIGNKAWIGWESLILKGVTIGDYAIVGARAVVTKDVPPHCVAAGNPARIIRQIEPKGPIRIFT